MAENNAPDSNEVPIEEKPVSYFRIGAYLGIALLAGYLLVWFVHEQKNPDVEYRSEENILLIEMPDHSQVFMSKRSYLKHPEKFDESVRKVNAEGEFWIELDENASGPFMFAVPGGVLQLNDDARAHIRAFESEAFVTVHLESGNGVFEIGKGWFQQLTPGDGMKFDVARQDLKLAKYFDEEFFKGNPR